MLLRALHACLFMCLVLLVPAFAVFESDRKVDNSKVEQSLAKLKKVVVWSWQNDDNLMYLDPGKISVASFCGTILIDQDRVKFRPRLNTLLVPKRIFVMPVFRLEARNPQEALSEIAVENAVDTIARLMRARPSPVVQIDFDASVNERKSYLRFLHALRRALPPDTAISITCLASWSLSDQWLTQGAADEAVVMLFSMGGGRSDTLHAIAKTHPFTSLSKKTALGFSTREISVIDQIRPSGIVQKADRVYLFASGGWTEARYQNLIHEVFK